MPVLELLELYAQKSVFQCVHLRSKMGKKEGRMLQSGDVQRMRGTAGDRNLGTEVSPAGIWPERKSPPN